MFPVTHPPLYTKEAFLIHYTIVAITKRKEVYIYRTIGVLWHFIPFPRSSLNDFFYKRVNERVSRMVDTYTI